MVDDVLLNKVAIIERCLARVRDEYLQHEDQLSADIRRQDAIVLNLQRACEASIDLAMHVVRKQRLGLPQDSRGAFAMLEQAALIDAATATRMQAMVGFRNIAVRQYQSLSLPILRAILDGHLDDFGEFTRALIRGRSTA